MKRSDIETAMPDIVRYGNIALADCGLPQALFARLKGQWTSVAWPHDANAAMYYKASVLAALKTIGPSAKCACFKHSADSAKCGQVTVADALLKRTCGVGGYEAQETKQ